MSDPISAGVEAAKAVNTSETVTDIAPDPDVVGKIENILPQDGDYMIEPAIAQGLDIYDGYVITNAAGLHCYVAFEEARSWGRRNGMWGGVILPDAFANVLTRVAEQKFANGDVLAQ